jgi:cyclin A
MFIASKFVEVLPPTVEDFVYITDNTYHRNEVLAMESHILNVLAFEINASTGLDFLIPFLKAARADTLVSNLAHYLCELTLQEHCFLAYPPSLVASCAVSLSLHSFNYPAWNPSLQHYSGYHPSALRQCFEEMLRVFRNARVNQLQAVRDKYNQSSFLFVSEVAAPSSVPGIFLQ